MRSYHSALSENTGGVDLIDACYHYTNVPVVFGKERVVVSCTMSIEGVWGEVYVADPGCGLCTTYEEWCMIGGEATMDIHVQGAMVRESGGGGDAGDIDTDGGTNGKGGEAAGDSSTSALGASDVVVTSVIGGGRNTSQARSRQMRAQIRLGWPLQGFERCSTAVCRAEQEAKVSDWATSTLAPLLEELRAEEPNGVQLEYDFEPITRRAMAVVLTSDLILAGMPLAVGFLYLWLYTSSLALALSGVLQLAFAWPCALFFYRYIFWLQHVENLTLLAAPLTAAFSLDAMALLVDAWHSSTVQPVHVLSSLRARLDWVIRDAGTAAFHSVAVGVAAFAGSGLSPLLNVAHLGLFCALQLTVQLLLALCLLPACLVLYHNWLEPKPNLVCMCLLKTRLLNGTPGTRVAKAGDVAGKATLFASVSQIWQPLEQTSTEHHHATRMIEATLPGLQQLQSVPKGSRTWPLPRLLGRWFLPLVENPKARALLLLFFALLLVPVGFGVGGASVAQVPQQRLPPRHPLRLTRTTIERNFRPSSREQTVAATLLWGVAGVARGGSDDGGNRWSVDLVRNSSFYGEIEWRDAEAFVFDATAQEHVHAACSLLRRQAWVRRDPARDIAEGGGDVACFVDEWRTWLNNESTLHNPLYGFGRFPIADGPTAVLALRAFLNSDRQRGARWGRHVGIFRGELKFVAVPFALTLRPSASRWQAFRMPEPTPRCRCSRAPHPLAGRGGFRAAAELHGGSRRDGTSLLRRASPLGIRALGVVPHSDSAAL
jgi:hypothetical protein